MIDFAFRGGGVRDSSNKNADKSEAIVGRGVNDNIDGAADLRDDFRGIIRIGVRSLLSSLDRAQSSISDSIGAITSGTGFAIGSGILERFDLTGGRGDATGTGIRDLVDSELSVLAFACSTRPGVRDAGEGFGGGFGGGGPGEDP